MKPRSILCTLLILCTISFAQGQYMFPHGMEPKQFIAKQKQVHGILIDVRTPEEYLDGTIPGALNFDFMAPDFKEQILKLDKTRVYFIFSGTGIRSATAIEQMKSLGFTKLNDLEGGIIAWKRLQMPID
jgi:rhodanese-related sulfurtransferase